MLRTALRRHATTRTGPHRFSLSCGPAVLGAWPIGVLIIISMNTVCSFSFVPKVVRTEQIAREPRSVVC